MKNTQRENINLVFNFVALIIATVSIVVALFANHNSEKANQLSMEANQLAREANQLVNESNQLTVTSLNADVQVIDKTWAPTIYTCKNPLTSNYLTFTRMILDVLVTNTGGATTSIINAKGLYPENINWPVVVYEDSSFSTEIELPVDIPAGSSRKYYIVAFDLISNGKSLDAMPPSDPVPYGETAVFSWILEFGNGQTVETEDTFSGYSAPNKQPGADCIYTNEHYP